MRTTQLEDGQIRRALAGLAGSKPKGQRLDVPSFHPFPARMPLSVAEFLIKALSDARDTVLDPMVGSGTTLVAAQRVGRRAIGVDRDPLALLLASTATRYFESQALAALKQRVLETAQQAAQLQSRSRILRQSLPPEERQFLAYWFPEFSQRQLFALAGAIQAEPDQAQRELAWVVFSTLIIAKSAGASRARDLPRSRPHRDDTKGIVYPFDAWSRRFDTVRTRLPFLDVPRSPSAMVVAGDARCLPAEISGVDLILTSPPYLNAIDYLRGHKFSLVWMGHRLDALRELRGTMVGSERGLWRLDGLPPTLESQLEADIGAARKRAILRQYLSDLKKILREIERALRPGGIALVVAGPRIVSPQEADAAGVMGQLSQSVGLRVVASVARDLSAARRSLPPPAWVGQNPLAQRMQQEVIVALRK